MLHDVLQAVFRHGLRPGRGIIRARKGGKKYGENGEKMGGSDGHGWQANPVGQGLPSGVQKICLRRVGQGDFKCSIRFRNGEASP